MSAGAVPSAVAVGAQSVVAAVVAVPAVVAAGAVALVAIALALARENDW